MHYLTCCQAKVQTDSIYRKSTFNTGGVRFLVSNRADEDRWNRRGHNKTKKKHVLTCACFLLLCLVFVQ